MKRNNKGQFQKGNGLIDITGQQFGRLTAIKQVGYNNNNGAKWLCKCVCGNTIVTYSSALRRGVSKSCGCLNQELRLSRKKHGMHKTKLYSAWSHMKQRCFNPKCKSYENYGGRGITVCKEWTDSFEAFRDWAFDNGYSEELTLDRIDNNGNYTPDNCRWASMAVQERNKRNNHYVTFNGEMMTMSECARKAGVSRNSLNHRIQRKNMTADEAVADILANA